MANNAEELYAVAGELALCLRSRRIRMNVAGTRTSRSKRCVWQLPPVGRFEWSKQECELRISARTIGV